MNVAIIGAGLIGGKRAAALNKRDKLLVICDIDLKTAKEQLIVNEKNKKLDMYSMSHFKKAKGYILINTY